MVIGVTLPGVGALGQAEADIASEGTEVRTVWTSEFGVPHPRGLTYVNSLGEFLVVGEDTSTLRLGPDEDSRGVVTLSSVPNPATLAYDAATDRVIMLGDGVQVSWSAASIKSNRPGIQRTLAPALAELNVESATFNPETRSWLVLPATGDELLRVPDSTWSVADSTSFASVNDAELVAFNVGDGFTYVLEGRRALAAVDAEGDTTMTFDLGSIELNEPTAMVFAPTSDATDDDSNLNLFVADSGGSDGLGGVIEISLATVTASSVPVDTASLVRLTHTSAWAPGSPDPAGVTYVGQTQELIVVDSEVDEVTGAGWHDVNMWRSRPTGFQTGTGTFWGPKAATFAGKVGYSREPTGAGYDPSSQTLFVSDDNARKIFIVSRGPDLQFGTGDDVVGAIDAAAYGSTDTEDPEFDVVSGHLFFLDGVGMEIFRIDPVDGVFGNGNDVKTQFDISHLGPKDFEGLASNPGRDTLYVGARVAKTIYEITKNGTVLREISVSGISGLRYISGLAVAQASDGSGSMNFYIVDRQVDNGPDPGENDGKLFEVRAPDSLGGTPNKAPIVSAGPDLTVTLPDAASLVGAVTDDGLPAGSQVSQNWSVVSAPSGAKVVFSSPMSPSTTATFSTAGSYTLRLTATDTESTSSDDVNVQVNPEPSGDSYAVSQSTLYGTVSGGLENTYYADGVYQVLTEQTNSKGFKARLDHSWKFDLTGGSQVVFALNGFKSGSENFKLAFSTNGTKWKTMTAWPGSQGVEYRYTMPAGTGGTVMIRIQDTDRTTSDTVRDRVSVDRVVLTRDG